MRNFATQICRESLAWMFLLSLLSCPAIASAESVQTEERPNAGEPGLADPLGRECVEEWRETPSAAFDSRWLLRVTVGLGYTGVIGVQTERAESEKHLTAAPTFGGNFLLGRTISEKWSVHAGFFFGSSWARDLDLRVDGGKTSSITVSHFGVGPGFMWHNPTNPLVVGFTAGIGRRSLYEWTLDLFGREDEPFDSVQIGLATSLEVGWLWEVNPRFHAGMSLVGNYILGTENDTWGHTYSLLSGFTVLVK